MFFSKLLLLALATIPSSEATRANRLRDDCKYNTYMCCWTQNDNGVEDNTDVCEPAPGHSSRRELRRGRKGRRGGDDSEETDSYDDSEETDSYDDRESDDMDSYEQDGMVSHESTFVLGSDDFDKSEEYEPDSDLFAGGGEGDVHCHGFVWPDGAHYESFIVPLYKYVRTFDHREARGYYGRCDRLPLVRMPADSAHPVNIDTISRRTI